jgi:hypothetical protein
MVGADALFPTPCPSPRPCGAPLSSSACGAGSATGAGWPSPANHDVVSSSLTFVGRCQLGASLKAPCRRKKGSCLEYSTDVVCLVVFWRYRYKLSLCDLAEMFLQRGIQFTHEAVRDWETRLRPGLIDALRKWVQKYRHGVGFLPSIR